MFPGLGMKNLLDGEIIKKEKSGRAK